MDTSNLQRILDLSFDQALLYHGYTDYMRDYELIIHCSASPATGIPSTHERLLFKNVVAANVSTSIPPLVWGKSLDDRLINYESGVELDGYVWGVKWQNLYPGARVISDSDEASKWEAHLGVQFHEVRIETNAQNIDLVFSELSSEPVSYTHLTLPTTPYV